MKVTDSRGKPQKHAVNPKFYPVAGLEKQVVKQTSDELKEAQRLTEAAIKRQADEMHQRRLLLEGVDGKNAKNANHFRLSYIEEYEEAEARRQIEELLGFEVPRPTGYHIAVKIYVRDEDVSKATMPDGTESLIYLPATMSANDKFRNCSALVLALGPDAYKGPKYISGPWVRVGDWVVIARNGGPQVNYRGVPVTFIPDDNIYCIIQDPTHVTRD